MDFSSSFISNEELEPECQNKVIEDSEIPGITNVHDDPATCQNPLLSADSAENAEKVGNRDVEIEKGSSDSHCISSAQSLECSSSELTENPQEPETGDSINIANVQVDEGMVPSSASSEVIAPENGVHNEVQCDFPREHQVEVTSVPNKGWETIDPPEHEKQVIIDTAAPIESVKEAVSKFGGILNWKEHKIQTVERQELVEQELGQAQEEIAVYKEQLEAAEDAKTQILNDLNSTNRFMEELNLSLEKAEFEERQAKQDCEHAKLRVEEMEQGIAHEASVVAKAQFEVVQDRHTAAATELKAVKDELEKLHVQYASLTAEKDLAAKRAEKTVSASLEVEKKMEELTLELIATKESLESAHAAHLEAEEQRTLVAMGTEKDSLSWEKELKQAEAKINELNHQILSEEDPKLKLDTATALLLNLKSELAAYSNKGSNHESSEEERNSKHNPVAGNNNLLGSQESITSAKDMLKEVKLSIEKERTEVDHLIGMSVSLKDEIEREKSELANRKRREGKTPVALASLEAEMNEIKAEVTLIQMKEKEAREKMVELPDKLRQAAKEADQTKLLVQLANDELKKAKNEADQVKAGASNVESTLQATQKEIEAATASERLAMGALKALEENESTAITGGEDAAAGLSLTLEEYYALTKRAHNAEEQENTRVAAAISQLAVAKESELQNMEKLEEVKREMAVRKAELQNALEKATKAEEEKLGIEQELRNWRSKQEKQRSGSEPDQGVVNSSRSPTSSVEHINEPKLFASPVTAAMESTTRPDMSMPTNTTETESSQEIKVTKKKKKSWFPRIIMFFSRRKVHEY